MKNKLAVSISVVIALSIFLLAGAAFASHPLITDDAGTQGKGKAQLEVNGQYDHNKDEGFTNTQTVMNAALTYGVADTVDVVLGVPYLFWNSKENSTGAKTSENGVSDISLQVKWRFYEKDGWSFALKPGLTLPTGDEDKGLGTGRATYNMFFITSKEAKPWEFHLNLGYIYNDANPKLDQQKNLWHASLAAGVEVAKNLKIVGNIGIQKTEEKAPDADNRAFALGGLIYSLSEHLDLDAGVKFGLSKTEPDYSILAGLTFKF
jgi:hypothetical protein